MTNRRMITDVSPFANVNMLRLGSNLNQMRFGSCFEHACIKRLSACLEPIDLAHPVSRVTNVGSWLRSITELRKDCSEFVQAVAFLYMYRAP